MEEARRFLRYVTPGLLYVVLLGALMLLIDPESTLRTINAAADSGISAALAGFLVTGGLGFFFGTIHHSLHWLGSKHGSDHRNVINRLVDRGVLQLRDAGTDELLDGHLKRADDAWVVLTALWYQRRETCKQIKSATDRSVSLSDLMHTLGTALVAAWAALLTVLIGALLNDGVDGAEWPRLRLVSAVGVAVLIVVALLLGYERAQKLTRRVIQQVLADVITAESSKLGTPVVTYLVAKPELETPTQRRLSADAGLVPTGEVGDGTPVTVARH